MHYSILVIINKPKTDDKEAIERAVHRALAPYEGDEWDWYQIGGRWSGELDGYQPEKDPANQRKCTMCNGTGTRTDWPQDITEAWIKECKGCNVCSGTGIEVVWPTSYKAHKGDVQPVASLTQEQVTKFYAICCEGYGWFGGESYMPWRPEGERLQPKEGPTLEWIRQEMGDGLAVVVDCHN